MEYSFKKNTGKKHAYTSDVLYKQKNLPMSLEMTYFFNFKGKQLLLLRNKKK